MYVDVDVDVRVDVHVYVYVHLNVDVYADVHVCVCARTYPCWDEDVNIEVCVSQMGLYNALSVDLSPFTLINLPNPFALPA